MKMSAKSVVFLVFATLFGCVICEHVDDKPVVNTPWGKIRGRVQVSVGGKKFASFENIPFAKPPVGNRRFEEPELIKPWSHILDATTPANTACPQTVITNQTIILGEEDCLHLNIYVPREEPNPEEKLDVIVRIHGGAFTYENGHAYVRADYLMEKDVIFVTFNYRLGILGFLSTLDKVVPGNNGLKDQVVALTWVQKNIASFGGNPGSVTLMGVSAGASSTHLHYFSNMSKGLFHRGLSRSGSALNNWTLQKRPVMKAKKLARSLGCPTNTSLSMVECMKQKPYKAIVEKLPIFFGYMMMPQSPFSPVVEKGPKPFLSDEPRELLKQGKVHDLPWITSNTKDEGLEPGIHFKNYLEEINKKWEDLAPILLQYQHTLPQSQWKEAAKKIKELYIGVGKDINKETYPLFIKLLSDRHFLVDITDAIKMQANVTKSPVYYYYFGYPGDDNPDQTVNHADDDVYFYGDFPPYPTELSPNDYKMLEVMTAMLVSYAKTGKPTIEGITWEPSNSHTLKYLNITGFQLEDIIPETAEDVSQKGFWNSFQFQKYHDINSADFPGFGVCENPNDNPVVNTPSGSICGRVRNSHAGKKFAAFEGIPYAKPPVGDRRFKEPEIVEPWNYTLDATTLTECPHTRMDKQSIIMGEEDCLYLNIYVPREEPDSTDKLDVIVRIHGGGFMYENGHAYVRADYLMDREVIFVTFNYRLGILGFLSTQDHVVPGNNGLKDQSLALTWIQKNIASFGGNPGSVTIIGMSAGAASSHLHYFSNMSKGLFHRGFSQSGCALNHWVLQKRPVMKANILAQSLECPTNTSLAMVECLKQKPYKDIVARTPIFFGYMMVPYNPFSPVVERGSNKPFLSDEPYKLLERGEVHDLPWLTSNTKDEGLEPGAYFEEYLDEINQYWKDVAAALLHYQYTLPPPQWEEAARKIKDLYIGAGKDINKHTYRQFIKILSDRHFLVDVGDAIKMQANVTRSPVYYYYFSYPGDNNPDQTVNHGDDDTYFYGDFPPYPTELTPNDYKMLEVMAGMLVSFAKTGKPTIEGVTWEPSTSQIIKYLNISGIQPRDMKLQTTEEMAPTSFWRSFRFRKYEDVNADDNL